MNSFNISFAISWVEDCLELNFKYVDYQTLAHLSYSSCICWTSVHATRTQHFLSVRVLISASNRILICFMSTHGDWCPSASAVSCTLGELREEVVHESQSKFCFTFSLDPIKLHLHVAFKPVPKPVSIEPAWKLQV